MQSRNRYHGIDPYAVKLIRFKAAMLSRHSSFSALDLEDIEQEMVIYYLQRISKFDASKSSLHTFTSNLINHCAATMIEYATTQKRNNGAIPSRFTVIDDDGESYDYALVNDGVWSEPYNPWDYLLLLELDIRKAMDELPPYYRFICTALKTKTLTEIAKDTGIPRTTLYDATLKIRAFFRERGIS